MEAHGPNYPGVPDELLLDDEEYDIEAILDSCYSHADTSDLRPIFSSADAPASRAITLLRSSVCSSVCTSVIPIPFRTLWFPESKDNNYCLSVFRLIRAPSELLVYKPCTIYLEPQNKSRLSLLHSFSRITLAPGSPQTSFCSRILVGLIPSRLASRRLDKTGSVQGAVTQ